MARPTLNNSPKFALLARRLKLPRVYVRGHLEYLWDAANESGDPVFASAEAVEAVVDWQGEPGAFVAAATHKGTNFLDALDDGRFMIHDYWHHAPAYVTNRHAAEMERRKGKTCEYCGAPYFSEKSFSRFCSDACRKSAYRVNQKSELETLGDESIRLDASFATLGDDTPAPAPSPKEKKEISKPIPIELQTRARKTSSPVSIGSVIGGFTFADSGSPIAPEFDPESDRSGGGGRTSKPQARGPEALAAQIAGLTGEAHWQGWWVEVLTRLKDHPEGVRALLDAMQRVSDARDPATRKAKDVGELRQPGRFLVKQVTNWMRDHGLRWPGFPSRKGAA